MDYDGASKEVVESLVEELTVRKVVINPNTTLLVTYLFYGIYLVLVTACVHLLRRDTFENRLFYLRCTLLLFALCTAMVVDVTLFRMQEAVMQYSAVKTTDFVPYLRYTVGQSSKSVTYTLYYFIPPIANTVAEFMLIHRCYLIWGCKKIIAIPLLVFSVIGSVICLVAGIIVAVGLSHLTFESSQKFIQVAGIVYFAGGMVSICVNVAVTALTAGKIWQINREAQVYMGVEYNTAKLSCAIRIILESGLLYPLMMIIQISFLNGFADRSQFPPIDLYPAVVLSAGIASTLAIVRAQLVKLFEKVNSSSGGVPEIQFNTARLGQLGGMSAISSTISQRTPIRRPSSDELESFKPLISPRHDVGLTLLSEDRAGSAGAPLISPRVDRLQPNR